MGYQACPFPIIYCVVKFNLVDKAAEVIHRGSEICSQLFAKGGFWPCRLTLPPLKVRVGGNYSGKDCGFSYFPECALFHALSCSCHSLHHMVPLIHASGGIFAILCFSHLVAT